MDTTEMNSIQFFSYIFSEEEFKKFTANQRVSIREYVNANFETFCTNNKNRFGEYGFSIKKVRAYLRNITAQQLYNIEFNY